MTNPVSSASRADSEETFLVEINIPSDLDLVSMIVDLGTSLAALKGFGLKTFPLFV